MAYRRHVRWLSVIATLAFVIALSNACVADPDDPRTATQEAGVAATPTALPSSVIPAWAGTASSLAGQSRELHTYLMLMAGRDVPCPKPCTMAREPENVWPGLGQVCSKATYLPDGVPDAQAEVRDTYAALHKAVNASCARIVAQLSTGEVPVDDAEWRMAATDADAGLEQPLQRAEAVLLSALD